MNRGKSILTLSIVMFICMLLVSGATFAYLQWQSSTDQQTLLNVVVSDNINMTIDAATISSNKMYPSSDCDEVAGMQGTSYVTIVNNTGILAAPNFKLKVKIEDKDGNIITGDDATGNDHEYRYYIKYAVAEANGSCSSPLYSGRFNVDTETTSGSGWYDSSSITLEDNNGFPMLSDGVNSGVSFNAPAYQTTTHSYKIWAWIDKEYISTNEGTSSSDKLQDATVTVSWSENSTVEQVRGTSTGGVSTPSLDDGMIPVTIANDGTVTTILSTDSDWYNYDDKEWANVVLVSSGSRENYQNTTGVTVSSGDILAYYVWIPRYKYKMNGTEESISIEFESSSSKSNGNATSTYLTHPAFTFGTQELSGIWVGKFETTGSESTPTILPNASSLTNQNVSTQFQTGLLFSGGTLSSGSVNFLGSSTYGLDSSTDSHMMKNSEWGAVAYLSHSQYGIDGQIRINNYNGFKTGCGASAEDGASSSTCEIAYGNATSYPQSTTGNITGVFDMSGGAQEYVMGAYSYNNIVPMSGYSSSWNSGFNGIIYESGTYSTYSSGIEFPPSKYYDMYKASQFTGSSVGNMSLCTLATCGGHALFETAGWYDDYAYFVYSTYPWLGRGGTYSATSGSGAFDLSPSHGTAASGDSFRAVLVR